MSTYHSYFKPWRRKAGVVTLVTACVFLGGWILNCVLVGGFDSIVGRLEWINFGALSEDEKKTIIFSIRTGDEHGVVGMKFEFDRDDHSGPVIIKVLPKDNSRSVWYWSNIIPLTLISVWLLLSKPRPKKIDTL